MTGEGGAVPGARPEVILYERDGCGLCEQAAAMLLRLKPRLGFTLRRVNIESDEGLLKRYLFEIPVVAVGGSEVARAPIRSKAALEDVLRDALAGLPARD